MTQKAEGIKASRLTAVEQSDGSLHVTLVIPPRGKAAFFSLFAELGTPLLLSRDAAEPQRIAPAGEDMSGTMGGAEPAQLAALLSHPRFQSWVNQQAPMDASGDAVQHARTWLEQAAGVGPTRYVDAATRQRVQDVVERYIEWHKNKFGEGESPFPA